MNIGMISEVYGGITTPPQLYGGIGASMYDYTEELIRRGHNVRLFAIEGSHTSGELVVVPSGDAQYNLYADIMPPFVAEARKHIAWADVWLDGSHHKRFARWCLENKPEVNVICPSWNPNATDLPQNPVLQSPHMYEVITGNKGGEHVPWFWFAIPQHLYEPQLSVPDDQVAVSIHVISEHKGTDLLVKSAAKHGFRVDLYGPKNDGFFNSKVRKNLTPNIRILGEIGMDRIQILRESVMSFTLSVWPEPGSRVTLESLTLGCPCVATASGCLKHYIADGVNGAIVDRDPDSIFEGYRRVLNGGRKMRKAAREMALDMFSMDKFMDNLEAVFGRVMDGERWSL